MGRALHGDQDTMGTLAKLAPGTPGDGPWPDAPVRSSRAIGAGAWEHENVARELDLADLLREAVAISRTLLQQDWREARLHAQAASTKAEHYGMPAVHAAAAALVTQLGAEGASPSAGYARALDQLSRAIDRAFE